MGVIPHNRDPVSVPLKNLKHCGKVDIVDSLNEIVEVEAEEPAAEKLTCGICFDDLAEADLTKLSGCEHTFCRECFTDFYKSLIEEQNKHEDLKCLQFGCTAKPTEEEIKSIIGEDCFQKFKKFQINTEVAQDQDLLFCSTVNCESILNKRLHSKSGNQVVC